MESGYERHPKNAEGPFYVVSGECISCGAPESEAPELMSHDESGHCYFARQPGSRQEVDAAIRATWTSCCGAVRYGGDDAEVVGRLGAIEAYSSCDHKLEPEPPTAFRSCVLFDFVSGELGKSVRGRLKDIVYFFVEKLTSEYTSCYSIRCLWHTGTFSVRWGIPGSMNTIRFLVKHQDSDRWSICIRDNDRATVGYGVALDRLLQSDERFQRIDWFEEDQNRRTGEATPHPY
jgi:hypothetical protein